MENQKLKVLIFCDYGSSSYTEEMIKQFDGDDRILANRTGKIVEYIERKAKKLSESDGMTELAEYLKEDKNNIAKMWYKLGDKVFEKYYTWSDEINWCLEMKIVEVDTSIPWKIESYDGAESIEYFNGCKILDNVTNYAEF